MQGAAAQIARGWGRTIHSMRVGDGTERRPELTLQQLAERLGVGATTVWRWEKGEVVPPLEFMLRIASVFNMPPAVLFPLPTCRVEP